MNYSENNTLAVRLRLRIGTGIHTVRFRGVTKYYECTILLIAFSFKAYYPSSSKKQTNWDRVVADIAAEEKDEKLEGDAALNKYFELKTISALLSPAA